MNWDCGPPESSQHSREECADRRACRVASHECHRVYLPRRVAAGHRIHDQREADLAFENPSDLAANQHCLDTIGDFTRRQAKPSGQRGIGPNAQRRNLRLLF